MLKYPIVQDFIPTGSKRRRGRFITKVLFLVAHDSGNPNSTARNNVDYFKRSCNDDSASAHIFVDDIENIECVPAFIKPEVAFHVLYNVTTDNIKFGDDANDAAIGVEYCFGKNIDANKAYDRYVWVLAYLCYVHKLSPRLHIVGHHILDPKNKIDPKNGLSYSGRAYEQLLIDVAKEYDSIVKGGNAPVSGMFKDIPDSHYAKKAAEWFGKKGIVLGDGKGTFNPNMSMSRADNVFVLYKTLLSLGLIKEE